MKINIFDILLTKNVQQLKLFWDKRCPFRDASKQALPERIYNPIKAMMFSAMFTFQLDNTKS